MTKTLIAGMISFLLLLTSGIGTLQAQTTDMQGTWEISWENRLGMERSFTVNLEQKGDMLDGSAEIPTAFFNDEAESGTEEFQILHADSHGNMLTFKIQPMHLHHEMMNAPSNDMSPGMDPHTIAVYAAVEDTEMEGFLTGVMPDPSTAVPFEARKIY